MIASADRIAEFRRLHASGCFVMPNPWDVGSARALASMGFRALATTSAGFAWTVGQPDNSIGLDQTLAHLRSVAKERGRVKGPFPVPGEDPFWFVQQRCTAVTAGVPCAMHRQRTDACLDAAVRECSVEVAWVDGKAVAGREDISRAKTWRPS